MEKFSLYDFLGLLLPGVLFLFFMNLIFSMTGVDITQFSASDRILDLGLAFCLAIFAGAVFYTCNFYLIKRKWYNCIFGMYRDVNELFRSFESSYETMRLTLNKKAKSWYGEEIFQSLTQQNDNNNINSTKLARLQSDFYDRMYYELEYNEKIETPKTMQSFYFFFRQTALACATLITIISFLMILSLLNLKGFATITQDLLAIAFGVFVLLLISVKLARWFRRQMVFKMYWMFFTHIKNEK